MTYDNLVSFVKDCGVHYEEKRMPLYAGLYYGGGITIDPTQPLEIRTAALLHEYGHHLFKDVPYLQSSAGKEWLASLFSLQTIGMFGGSPALDLMNLRNYKWNRATETEKIYILQQVRNAVDMFCMMVNMPQVIAL